MNRHLRGDTWFSGNMFVSYLRMRTGSIGASGHEEDPVWCRHGCVGEIETLQHILSHCLHMTERMHTRHNKAQKTITNHLQANGWSVRTNLTLTITRNSDGEILKPDIVAVSPDGRQCFVLDVTCPYESQEEVLCE